MTGTAEAADSVPAATLHGHAVTIQRTEYGIPHISAGNYGDLGYGYGYAFAQDNFCELADRVLTLRGERSRYFGPDALNDDALGETADNLSSDTYFQGIRQAGTVRRLVAQPAPYGPTAQVKQMVDGYVAGVNRYLGDTGVAGLPDPTCRGKAWVGPITASDIWTGILDLDQVAGTSGVKKFVGDAAPPTAAGAAVSIGSALGSVSTPTGPAPGGVPALPTSAGGLGSNGWALGRDATSAHDAMVLGNPHLPWLGNARLYQVQLTIPGVMDVSGVSIYGTPVVVLGHTQNLAWTQTTSYASHAEFYRLTLAPGDPTSYLVDGKKVAMAKRTVRVSVLGADGKQKTVTRTLYDSRYGPVLGYGWDAGSALSIRDANAENIRSMNEWLAMDSAQSLGQLRAVQRTYQGMPWTYTTAADAGGSVYFTDSSIVPDLTDAQLTRCTLPADAGPPALDGSTRACDWGDDPTALEPGVYGPAHAPALTRSDYVANSNNDPALANPSAPLTGYPAVYGTTTQLFPRPQLGLRMIADRLTGADGLGKPGFTLASLQATTLGDRDLSGEFGRDDAVAMCRAHPVLTASDGKQIDVRAACDALAAWDLHGGATSRGAVLWAAFFDPLLETTNGAWARVPFDPAHPLTTPSGVNGDNPQVRTALADAVESLAAQGLPPDVATGEAYRWAGVPLHGCTDDSGCFNVLTAQPTSGTAGGLDLSPANYAAGSTFIMAVELTPAGPRTRTVLTYSESTNPKSPHYADQTALFSKKQWVTERFTPAEIKAAPGLQTTVLRR
ncbi:penicillin acylase family protein [Catenulispora sp. NF23]|uniref:penicillin acylase family protein n=1 Tax=Catenulispora pinistramenti TaxID=2705254 RepID=UPI001BA4B4D3|nr:penicillin acylase family protein [Catenulispora pinistramenti]MBS2532628.1 penicillin acylase family protein [Catenulispora pinistramenti]